jgi:outer membrane protein insertion porin family
MLRYCGSKVSFFFFLLLLSSLLFVPAQADNRHRPVIEKIVVEGNRYFSDGKVKDQMTLKQNRWFNLFKKRRFSPKKAELDKTYIDSLYHVHGFLEMESEIVMEEKKKNRCELKVTISEGPQTRFGSITIRGGLAEFKEKSKKELKSVKTGNPFNWSKLFETAFNIKTIYANNGYPYADVKILITQGEQRFTSDVVFEITEDKKVFFGNVAYEGLKLTKRNVARRELTIKEGELYSREKITDSQQRVYSTGLFSYISLKAKDVDKKPDRPDFVLRVIERKPNYVGAKVELAQNQPQSGNQQEYLTVDFTGEWGNRNLAGTSRKIGFSGYYSFKVVPEIERLSNQYTLRYVEPWFLGTRTLLDLDVYYEPGVKSAVQKYRIESYGGNINFSREFGKDTKVWLTCSYQQVNIYDIPLQELETYKEEQGINVRRKIILWGDKDTRSSIFIPLDGSFTQLYTQYVGGFLGGDNHFYKVWFSWARYNQLSRKKELNVLATRVKFGYADGLSLGDRVPTFDRFYMGGASTMRGFRENSLGPVDVKGDPAGGKVMVLGNVEYRRALFWKFGFSLFVDTGNLWDKIKHVNLGDFKLTSGMGIQFFTPVGPLRLDYGRQIPVKENPKTGRFHLSILYAF